MHRAEALDRRLVEDLQTGAEEAMAELGVPGFSLWLLSDGEEEGFQLGVTSADNPLPVDADTVFQAGLITKTLTATAAVRLAEAGRLDLDAPVRRYLPDVRLADETVAAAVTMRDLLTHAGGFVGDWFEDYGWGDEAVATYVEGIEQLPQLTPLRAVWSYNNAGFVLAGHVLQVVAEKPYEDVVREHVLEDAVFFPWDAMLRRFVAGHVTVDDVVRVAEPWAMPRCAAPAGGLIASARTLIEYARIHLDDERLAAMREPVLPIQVDQQMGLAWFVMDRGGVRFVDHGGTTNGQQAWLALFPKRRFAVAALANHAHGSALISRVSERLLEAFFGVPPWQPETFTPPAAALAEYSVRYEMPLNVVDLRLEDGGLVLHLILKGGFPKPDSPPRPAPLPAPVAFHADDAFHVVEGVLKNARGQFLRDEDGRLEWLRFGLRIHAPVS